MSMPHLAFLYWVFVSFIYHLNCVDYEMLFHITKLFPSKLGPPVIISIHIHITTNSCRYEY